MVVGHLVDLHKHEQTQVLPKSPSALLKLRVNHVVLVVKLLRRPELCEFGDVPPVVSVFIMQAQQLLVLLLAKWSFLLFQFHSLSSPQLIDRQSRHSIKDSHSIKRNLRRIAGVSLNYLFQSDTAVGQPERKLRLRGAFKDILEKNALLLFGYLQLEIRLQTWWNFMLQFISVEGNTKDASFRILWLCSSKFKSLRQGVVVLDLGDDVALDGLQFR